MRVRKKSWAENEVQNNPYVVKDFRDLKGKWAGQFNNNNPIHIEIGCGKGSFISNSANQNPDINFIAIEMQTTCIAQATRRVRENFKPLNNLFFIHTNGDQLDEIFGEGEISRIYINFCDPWHKTRQSKRRLTHKNFLEKYKKVFGKNGELFFKTDNEPLFEFSLESFKENGWILKNVTRDLHKDQEYMKTEPLMTEYEQRFYESLVPIFRLEAYFQ